MNPEIRMVAHLARRASAHRPVLIRGIIIFSMMTAGPNDLFEVGSNNSPDPVDDDDEVAVDWDEMADWPLENDAGEDDE